MARSPRGGLSEKDKLIRALLRHPKRGHFPRYRQANRDSLLGLSTHVLREALESMNGKLSGQST